MNVKPLGDRVIVQAIDQKETVKSGIIIPDTVKEKPQEGKIVATGPGKIAEDGKKIQMEVKVGDTVLFGKYSGTEIKIDSEEFLIMHQDDIFGIIN